MRALSYRRSALQVMGRNGHAATSRIMPAVGDQASQRSTAQEKDDDWIKIDKYPSPSLRTLSLTTNSV